MLGKKKKKWKTVYFIDQNKEAETSLHWPPKPGEAGTWARSVLVWSWE